MYWDIVYTNSTISICKLSPDMSRPTRSHSSLHCNAENWHHLINIKFICCCTFLCSGNHSCIFFTCSHLSAVLINCGRGLTHMHNSQQSKVINLQTGMYGGHCTHKQYNWYLQTFSRYDKQTHSRKDAVPWCVSVCVSALCILQSVYRAIFGSSVCRSVCHCIWADSYDNTHQ